MKLTKGLKRMSAKQLEAFKLMKSKRYLKNSTASDNLNDSGVGEENTEGAFNTNELPDAQIFNSQKCDPTGRRIISCRSLISSAIEISHHFKTCTSGKLTYDKEKRQGLESSLFMTCICGWSTSFQSNTDEELLPINDGMGLGALNAPISHNALSYFLTPMDIPYPSQKFFSKTLDKAGEWVKNAAEACMIDAGKEEHRIAIDEGKFLTIMDPSDSSLKNVGLVTSVVDGAWSKRSYGHSYNSNYGVGVIMGLRTSKVLSANIRQKVCHYCKFFIGKNIPTPNHECCKNWDKPSTAMEADSILEGFGKSIDSHNVIYDCFIGDGDSSVHNAVINVYQPYGIVVRKIECLNHVVRNLNTHLRRIATGKVVGKNAKPITTEERSMTGMEDRFRRIGLAVHGAVNYYNQLGTNEDNVRHLGDDISNIPYHVFGDHANCKDYFCRRKSTEPNFVPEMKSSGLWAQLAPVIQRTAAKSFSLIEKQNSNIVECFMATVNRYMDGKRINLGGRNLYLLRISAAVLSHNVGGFWCCYVLQTVFGKQPNILWGKCKNSSLRRRKKPRKVKTGRKIKFGFLNQGDKHYGINPMAPDMPLQCRKAAIERLATTLNVDYTRQQEIEEMTRLQTDNEMWFLERRQRITASQIGRVCKLKTSTDNTSILKDLLGHSRNVSTVAMRFGNEHEDDAIRLYEIVKGMEQGSVRKCGFFVSREVGLIGASPDGLVGDIGLVEVKCPYSVKDSPPAAWCEKSSSPIRKISADPDIYELKKTHNYYYQVVTQLYTTDRLWCDFCVWTMQGILIIRVGRNEETDVLWEKIKERARAFWEDDLAPELVDPRKERGFDEYHCPLSRLTARKLAKSKKLASECDNDVAMDTSNQD